MQKKSLFVSLACLVIWYCLTASLRDPQNPPTANTGAPGEQTCGKSGCHSGGAYIETVTISGIPDTVAPNQSYSVTLKNTSNAVRAGFQLTCLDANNAKCGTLTAGSGTSIGSSTPLARQYVRQSQPKNLVSGSTSWTFTWKSPATAAGNTVHFYFSSLCANGNGNDNGDKVILGDTTAVLGLPVSAVETAENATWVSIHANAASKTLDISLKSAAEGQLQVLDLAGKQVFAQAINPENTLSLPYLTAGVYVALVEANGKKAAKRFVWTN